MKDVVDTMIAVVCGAILVAGVLNAVIIFGAFFLKVSGL